jgi:molybdopterin synthase sulfur carrier subunit
MRVELRLFAALREELGVAHESVELPPDVRTVADARRVLGERSPSWQRALAHARVRAAVDRRLATESTELKEACELAFFPPVTGG